MYRRYKEKLAEQAPPTFASNNPEDSLSKLPVRSEQPKKMSSRPRHDSVDNAVLSLIKGDLDFEGVGASHVFVILGASVSADIQMTIKSLNFACYFPFHAAGLFCSLGYFEGYMVLHQWKDLPNHANAI